MQLYTKILLGMLLGVVLGFLVGPNSPLLPQDGVRLLPKTAIVAAPEDASAPAPMSSGVRSATILEQRRVGPEEEWLQVEWRLTSRQLLKLERDREDGAAETALDPNARHVGWVRRVEPSVTTYSRIGQTLVDSTEWLGRLFLAMIRMVVVPLVFFSLTVGVASLGDLRKLGRLGGRTIGLFFGTTFVALVLGLGLANVFRPGSFMSPDDRARLLASYAGDATAKISDAAEAPTLVDQLIGIVPSNPIGALAAGDMLQIIFFAVMFGVALTMLDARRSKPVVQLLDNCNEAMVMLVHVAMMLAPVGVAALLFKVVGSTGLSVLMALLAYSGLVLLGLLLHLTLTYGGLVTFLARLPFIGFLRALRPALMLAFSTSSSSATLPITKECVEENIGVSNEISSFVLPLGATVNMDGTALYQGIAALFIAQIYTMDLSVADQLSIVVSATLASVGAAGVPGAGMITLAMVLTAVGVPLEGLALVLGVDRLLDMFRTATNVTGDATATVVMARLEGDTLQLLDPSEDRARPDRGFEGRLDRGAAPVRPDELDREPHDVAERAP